MTAISLNFSARRNRPGRGAVVRGTAKEPAMGQPIGQYARITVHEDVVAAARRLLSEIEEAISSTGMVVLDDEDLRPLRDLVDPLPEPDVNGVTPTIDRIDAFGRPVNEA